MKIDLFITALRETDPAIKSIYMHGGCYRFAAFLQALIPHGVLVINGAGDHVALCIGGRIYDINGEIGGEWVVMNDTDIIEAESWSFSRNTFLQVGECPACDEPILHAEHWPH